MGLERVTWGFCALAFGIGSNAWAAPNYIVIIADDYGSDKMRAPFAWNGTGTTTPTNFPVTTNLNALGAAGLRFTNAWANPVCSSSRASINTGNYAWRNDIGTQLEPGATNQLGDVDTLAGVLAGSYGYQTALFGKWHLGERGSPDSSIWTVDGSPGAWDDVFPAPMKRGDGIHPGYGYFEGYLEGAVDFDGDDDWDHIYLDAADNWQLETAAMDGLDYADEVIVDAATAWIADAVADAEGDPWLAVIALSAPHAMQTGDYFESDVMNDTECDKLDDTTRPYYACLHDAAIPCSDAGIYQALVECMDERIGEFLAAVAADAADQTIVVFMGDNGTPYGVMKSPYSDAEDSFIHDVGKGTVYQSGVRVPFIMASFDAYEGNTPDFITAEGLNVPALVQTWDLYATMVDASAGASGTDGTETDSISLCDCFNSTSSTCAGTDRFHYAEIFDTDSVTGELTRGEATVGVMVGPAEWSMVATYDATSDCMNTELYKLRTGATLVDPQQTTILASGSAGYSKGACTKVRAKFMTVDPDGAGWMPRTGAGNIKWCATACPS